MAVAQTRQISSAAKLLKVDGTTVSRRLRRLERTLGQRLMEQTREGQVLTENGERLLVNVERMADEAAMLFDAATNRQGLEGQVRLSVSEGFGIWFLARHLPKITKRHPNLTVELAASSGFLSPSKREADIAVMLSRPKAGPLISRKLADYDLMLYASPDYLNEMGDPREAAHLASHHRLVGYISDLLYAPELDYLSEFHSDLQATVRSSSINAQLQLLAAGAGVGVLPCFMGDREPHVVRVLPAIRITRSFWVVTHRDNHQLGKVKFLSGWLSDLVAEHRASLRPA